MSSPSTHQDSPKVPEIGWPTLKMTRRSPYHRPQDMSAFPGCDCGCQNEAETYVPVSALLSDEVVEAACRSWWDGRPGHLPWERVVDKNLRRKEMRTALQAAIEHVGGGGLPSTSQDTGEAA